MHLIEEYLKTLRGLKVELYIPKKGSKLKLVEMIENNIEMNLKDKDRNALEDLRQILGIDETLNNLECYDISNLKDSYMVGASITYEKNSLNKSKYRKYKIKSTLTQNDVMCMQEVISRRLKHIDTMPLPDIFLIDGGLNQVRAVKQVLKENDVDVPVIGMVKDDKHRTRGIINLEEKEIDLREDKNNRRLFKLLTELQDEVHRFVITYHRSLRDKIK